MQTIDYTAKIPALPIITDFERTEKEVQSFCFATNQEEFIYANSFCKQIGILCSYLRNEYLNVSYGRIGNLLGKSRSTVYAQYKNYIRGEGKNGRLPSLSNEEMETIIRYIQSLHTNAEYPVFPTFDDIQDFIIENFHKDIKDDTIKCIIERILFVGIICNTSNGIYLKMLISPGVFGTANWGLPTNHNGDMPQPDP